MEGVCRMNDVGLAFEDLENLLLPVKLPPFLIFFFPLSLWKTD